MNIIERTIYVSLIALMVTVISVGYVTKAPSQEPEQQNALEQPLEPQVENKFTQPTLLTVELGGYVSHIDVSGDPFAFSKTYTGGKRIDIEIASMYESYEEYITEKEKYGSLPKMYNGPNGWTYYIDEYWDKTGKTNQEGGNLYRTFLKEEDGILVTITQYDYTGGKYDKEVNSLISKIKLYGKSW